MKEGLRRTEKCRADGSAEDCLWQSFGRRRKPGGLLNCNSGGAGLRRAIASDYDNASGRMNYDGKEFHQIRRAMQSDPIVPYRPILRIDRLG
jgi:hypothetical protein